MTVVVQSVDELERKLAGHLKRRQAQVSAAIIKAAYRGIGIVQRRVPVAYSELNGSVHIESASISQSRTRAVIAVDAPHAWPVEVGSRPHWLPLRRLVEWVKLRAAQGLLDQPLEGHTSAFHAKAMASAMRGMEKNGAVDINAPWRIAKAIQIAIANHGTKPHWYARSSLDEIMHTIVEEVHSAFSKNA